MGGGAGVCHSPRAGDPPEEPAAERESFGEVLLVGRLRRAAARFGDATQSLFAEMKARDEESAVLTVTRDRLLPRLLSGDLIVS